MPLMMSHTQAEQWLNDGVAVFDTLLAEQDVSGLTFYPVSRAVNRSGNEGEKLTEAVELDED